LYRQQVSLWLPPLPVESIHTSLKAALRRRRSGGPSSVLSSLARMGERAASTHADCRTMSNILKTPPKLREEERGGNERD
jgi:hypothetical protein